MTSARRPKATIIQLLLIITAAIFGSIPFSTANENTNQRKSIHDAEKSNSRNIDDVISVFVRTNMFYTVYHEFGHAMISLYGLPVLGREEDAADGFAALMLLNTTRDSRDAIYGAFGWALLSRDYLACIEAEPTKPSEALALRSSPPTCSHVLDDNQFWGAHSPERQRYFYLLCLSVGAKPHLFIGYARAAGMPYKRIKTCARDYWSSARSWWNLLKPHYVANSQTKTPGKIYVVYDRDIGKEWGNEFLGFTLSIIDRAADDITNFVTLPEDVVIEFLYCGEANAFWTPLARTMTICVEDVLAYFDLITTHIDTHTQNDARAER